MNLKLICIVLPCFFLGCTTTENSFSPNKSFLAKENNKQNTNDVIKVDTTVDSVQGGKTEFLPKFESQTLTPQQSTELTNRFSDQESVKITVDGLALKDYLHYVFGEVLDINYILGDAIQKDTQPVTLNISDEISKRKLFLLSQELLVQRDYVIRLDQDVFYIHKAEGTGPKGELAYGYGKNLADVPNSSLDIVQMVPLSFGLPTSFANSIRNLTKVQARADFERNAILLQGKRRDIIRGLEFINLMDSPQYQGRHIGSYQANFVSVDELINILPNLLEEEGLTVNGNGRKDRAISLIPLERLGTIIIFASEASIINRVAYWAAKIDKPATGSEAQYFVYNPNYARAADLGESISQLISGRSPALSGSTSAAEQNNQQTATSKNRVVVATENMNLVVDERSNSLIFKTTGTQYQSLLPLIKRLDVLPKQIMLEVVIAEVSMTDEFKQGVEFAFSNGNYNLSTEGAFFGDGFGGLSYLLQGTNGQLALNLFQTNSLVNILSRPSLVVRDGIQASISVGTDIPIVAGVTTDPVNGATQSVEYRKTGVELQVTPTVNAQGFVIMSIRQKISNQVDSGGTTVGGNPSLFERSLDTEVVAESGQTIVLGGLISENKSNKDTKVPFFGDIPIIGNLFKAKTESGDKTELVLLVTPRIIESADEWEEIRSKFSSELKKIAFY